MVIARVQIMNEPFVLSDPITQHTLFPFFLDPIIILNPPDHHPDNTIRV